MAIDVVIIITAIFVMLEAEMEPRAPTDGVASAPNQRLGR